MAVWFLLTSCRTGFSKPWRRPLHLSPPLSRPPLLCTAACQNAPRLQNFRRLAPRFAAKRLWHLSAQAEWRRQQWRLMLME